MNARALTLAAIIMLGGVAPALTADPAGQAISVNKNAAAAGTVGGNRTLVTSGMVYTGDRITTDSRGEADLRFMDDTRMIVGPNSNLTIDKFVVSGPASAQKVTIDAAKGAFRFITGTAPKQAYEINTPVATISVRGTEFDFASGPDGMTIMLYRDPNGGQSSVQWCDKVAANSRIQPSCYEISDPCTMIVVPNVSDYRMVTNVYEKTKMAQTLFPFVDKNGLRSDFKVQFSECAHYDANDSGVPILNQNDNSSPAQAPPSNPVPDPPFCSGAGCP